MSGRVVCAGRSLVDGRWFRCARMAPAGAGLCTLHAQRLAALCERCGGDGEIDYCELYPSEVDEPAEDARSLVGSAVPCPACSQEVAS